MSSHDQTISQLLRGAVDTHVHSFPDVIVRKVNDRTLVEQAQSSGIGALVLKCHHGSTCERAWHLNQQQGDVQVFGGIVLNHAAGGLNPHAVDAAIRLGATQVWMPTKSAANHQHYLGGSDGISVLKDEQRTGLRTEVIDILKLVAAADRVLATGHLSPEESRVLVEEALSLGVQRISITHPEWGVTAMPVPVQQELSRSGACSSSGVSSPSSRTFHCASASTPLWPRRGPSGSIRRLLRLTTACRSTRHRRRACGTTFIG